MYLNFPVRYLQREDFDKDGNITNRQITSSGKKTIIMLQSNFCHWCKKAKPDYQKLGNELHEEFYVTTVQGDGNVEGEKEMSELYRKIDPGFRGFPTYVLYNEEGKYIKTHNGGRDIESLKKFMTS